MCERLRVQGHQGLGVALQGFLALGLWGFRGSLGGGGGGGGGGEDEEEQSALDGCDPGPASI